MLNFYAYNQYELDSYAQTPYSRDSNLSCTDCDKELFGSKLKDEIEGTNGPDTIKGLRGDDILRGNEGGDDLQGGRGDDTLYGGDGDDNLLGNRGDDSLYGGNGDDFLRGGRGDDTLYGESGDDILGGDRGDDRLNGGDGDDVLLGGRGNDWLEGGRGDDELEGGSGEDIFFFKPDRTDEGNDIINDFNLSEGDKIRLDIADILNSDSNLTQASGDPGGLEISDLDHDPDWSITGSRSGDVTIVHPNGEIVLKDIPFGETTNSFVKLAELGALDLIDSRGESNQALIGTAADEDILGGDGNDTLTGGDGADSFIFNPNNTGEGNDVITDFNPEQDTIALEVANVLASDPDLLSASGEADAFEFSDLDADPDWNLSANTEGEAVITHPNGTITLEGIQVNESIDTFAEVGGLGLIELRETLGEATDSDENITGFIEPKIDSIVPMTADAQSTHPKTASEMPEVHHNMSDFNAILQLIKPLAQLLLDQRWTFTDQYRGMR